MATFINIPVHKPIIIHEHQREEFKEALNRALNTWEDRPQWLVTLADHLNETPQPRSRFPEEPKVDLQVKFPPGALSMPKEVPRLAPADPYAPLFQVDSIPGYLHGLPSTEFRITHIATDSRVATCYSRENANMVRDALNAVAANYP